MLAKHTEGEVIHKLSTKSMNNSIPTSSGFEAIQSASGSFSPHLPGIEEYVPSVSKIRGGVWVS
jgi:hypothetical protein